MLCHTLVGLRLGSAGAADGEAVHGEAASTGSE